MLESISLKSKLLIPVFVLIGILIFLGSVIILSNYNKIQSLNKLDEKVILSTVISDTLHSIQKERGLSSGFVTNNNNNFKEDLLLQRKITDKNIEKLKYHINFLPNCSMKELFKQIVKKIKEIDMIRYKIDSHAMSSYELIEKYSQINERLLALIVNISKRSHVPSITQNILTYINFLYLKEYAGLQRAQGIIILSTKDTKIANFIEFTNLMALQKEKESMFLKYSSVKIRNYYTKVIQNEIFTQFKNLERSIIKDYKENDMKPKVWYDLATKKLDKFELVIKFIKHDTASKIKKELNSSRNLFLFVVGLTVVSFLVFVLMIIAFIRMAKEEQRLRLVMNKYIISSVTDLKGIIIDVSEAFCDISGYKRAELIGKNHNIVRHPEMKSEIFKGLWNNIKSGKSWSGKVKNLKKDGKSYWVYANVEPLYDKHKKIDSYISIRLDITRSELLLLKVQEEEIKNKFQYEIMQQQYRLAQMGEMISMIAHQWRQPLSAITAATGVISIRAKKNKLKSEDAMELADKIKNFSLHLSNTIDDFRSFFKPNKEKKITDFKKIIDSVLLIIENSLKQNHINLVVEYVDIVEFETYDNELKQVLLNLIKNAEDILLENKILDAKIVIKVEKEILKVIDNAGGVPDEIIDKIFDPYFSTKLKKDGTGLGLYMSKTIVEEHCQGKLSVKNNENNAIFEINLKGKK